LTYLFKKIKTEYKTIIFYEKQNEKFLLIIIYNTMKKCNFIFKEMFKDYSLFITSDLEIFILDFIKYLFQRKDSEFIDGKNRIFILFSDTEKLLLQILVLLTSQISNHKYLEESQIIKCFLKYLNDSQNMKLSIYKFGLQSLLNLMKNQDFYKRVICEKLMPIIKQLEGINQEILLEYGLKIVLVIVIYLLTINFKAELYEKQNNANLR